VRKATAYGDQSDQITEKTICENIKAD